jgi:hypothetical protein
MSEPVSLLGFVLEYVTDIAAIAGHVRFSLPHLSFEEYYKDIPGMAKKCTKNPKRLLFCGKNFSHSTLVSLARI